jgi:hypothetical protein
LGRDYQTTISLEWMNTKKEKKIDKIFEILIKRENAFLRFSKVQK